MREELGWPIVMTPFAQMLLTQAVMNVTGKERYAMIPDEVIRYALGSFGRPNVPIDGRGHGPHHGPPADQGAAGGARHGRARRAAPADRREPVGRGVPAARDHAGGAWSTPCRPTGPRPAGIRSLRPSR